MFSGVINVGADSENYHDVLYGGEDADHLWVGNGGDVIYGGDGDDHLEALELGTGKTAPTDGGRDRLLCGEGFDRYRADPDDHLHSSCEKGQIWEDGKLVGTGGPPLILLDVAVLLLGSGLLAMSRYATRHARLPLPPCGSPRRVAPVPFKAHREGWSGTEDGLGPRRVMPAKEAHC